MTEIIEDEPARHLGSVSGATSMTTLNYQPMATASSTHRLPTPSLAQRVAVARGALGTVWNVVTGLALVVCGIVGFTRDDYEYGVGGYCPNCPQPFFPDHDADQTCGRALVGECDICLATVSLDVFGNCVAARASQHHGISKRRPVGVRK